MINCIQLLLLSTLNFFPHHLFEGCPEVITAFQKAGAAIRARADAFPPLEHPRMVLPPEYLAAYERFAEEILETWRNRTPEYFVELTCEIIEPLRYRWNDDRAFYMARKYLLTALPHINSLPFSLQMRLATSLDCRPRTPLPPDFVPLRKEAVETRLRVWQRMLDAVDPAWDPNDIPVKDARFHVSPVPPELRAAADTYQQNLRWHVSQGYVRRELGWYERAAVTHIASLYSRQPRDFEELQKLLDAFIKDKAIRQKVLQEAHNKVEAIRKAKALFGEPED